MLRKNDQFAEAPKEKYKSVITVILKDIWPEIIKSQKLGQSHHKDNRYRKNLRSRF